MKFERRFDTSLSVSLLVPLVSILCALAVSGLFLWIIGINPAEAMMEMWSAAFVDSYGISESLTKAIPLMLCGTGLAICYRMLLWNIGAQGQAVCGALATVAIGQLIPNGSGPLLITLMAVCAMLAGGLWAAIAGWLKVKWNVNEIISTLMLNYIILNVKDFFVYGPWRDPSSLGFPITTQLPKSSWLPMLGFERVHAGLLVAIFLAFLFNWLLARSRWGYEIRVTGENPRTAKFAGINSHSLTIKALFVSGALCGLAGMTLITGLEHRLQGGFNADFGFTAIIVIWLANLNPVLGILVSFLMGGLLVGAESLQVTLNLPVAGTQIIQGLILLFLVAGQFFKNYRLVRKEVA